LRFILHAIAKRIKDFEQIFRQTWSKPQDELCAHRGFATEYGEIYAERLIRIAIEGSIYRERAADVVCKRSQK